jgi:hypothetical protein
MSESNITGNFIISSVYVKLVHYVIGKAIQFPHALPFLGDMRNSILPPLSSDIP